MLICRLPCVCGSWSSAKCQRSRSLKLGATKSRRDLLPWKLSAVPWKSMVGSDVFPTKIGPFFGGTFLSFQGIYLERLGVSRGIGGIVFHQLGRIGGTLKVELRCCPNWDYLSKIKEVYTYIYIYIYWLYNYFFFNIDISFICQNGGVLPESILRIHSDRQNLLSPGFELRTCSFSRTGLLHRKSSRRIVMLQYCELHGSFWCWP